MSFLSLKTKKIKSCIKCSGKDHSPTYDELQLEFSNNQCTLLSPEYTGCNGVYIKYMD